MPARRPRSSPLPALLGLIVPPRCALCGRPCGVAGPLCGRCAAGLERLAAAGAMSFDVGGLTITSALVYEGPVRELVAALKFRGRAGLASLAAGIVATAIEVDPGATLVPVPGDPLRRRLRGHDPAAAIAAELAAVAGVASAALLRRRHGPRQVGRSRAERLRGPSAISADRASGACLIVDDVVTTGATLRECARALLAAGADQVCGVTLARSL